MSRFDKNGLITLWNNILTKLSGKVSIEDQITDNEVDSLWQEVELNEGESEITIFNKYSGSSTLKRLMSLIQGWQTKTEKDLDIKIDSQNSLISQNASNIEGLVNQISNISKSSYDNYIETAESDLTLGYKTGTAKILVDGDGDTISLSNSSTTFSINGAGANVNTINTQTTKVGGYSFQKNPQNNHMTLKWVGDN